MPRVHVPVIRWTGVVNMRCASSLLDVNLLLSHRNQICLYSHDDASGRICLQIASPISKVAAGNLA